MFATIEHDKLARPDEGTMSSCCTRPRSSRAGSTILLFSKRVDVLDRVPLPGWQVRGQHIHVPTASMLHSLSFAHRWREVDALWCVAHAQCREQTGDECDANHGQRPDEVRLDRHGKQDGK
jgi:hypothetical protein